MKPIRVRSLLWAIDVFKPALQAAREGKAQSFVMDTDDGTETIEYEVRVTKFNGKRISLATIKEAFKGVPRP